MSCILRAGGREFEPDAFLAGSPFDQATVHAPGERFTAGAAVSESRGLSLTVSDAEMDDLDGQIEEAIEFLDRHEDELRRLGRYHGVEVIEIDFGIEWRDVAAQTDWFPPELLWRAGALDIGLRVSHYLAQQPES
jgi:hypothetical protein